MLYIFPLDLVANARYEFKAVFGARRKSGSGIPAGTFPSQNLQKKNRNFSSKVATSSFVPGLRLAPNTPEINFSFNRF
jgi:hypothetical protein